MTGLYPEVARKCVKQQRKTRSSLQSEQTPLFFLIRYNFLRNRVSDIYQFKELYHRNSEIISQMLTGLQALQCECIMIMKRQY